MKNKLFMSCMAGLVLYGSCAFADTISFTFSDKDWLSGASWGTMTLESLNSKKIKVTYAASPDTIIPSGSEATGFGFNFDSGGFSISNPLDTEFDYDENVLNWHRYDKALSAGVANGDEFDPAITKFDFLYAADESSKDNWNAPGIKPGSTDVFFLDFVSDWNTGGTTLAEFVNYVGVRLQSLPDSINEGSLFLAGGGNPVPEPATVLLFGAGLVGLAGAAARRKRSKK